MKISLQHELEAVDLSKDLPDFSDQLKTKPIFVGSYSRVYRGTLVGSSVRSFEPEDLYDC
jgi:hypothetical protein